MFPNQISFDEDVETSIIMDLIYLRVFHLISPTQSLPSWFKTWEKGEPRSLSHEGG